MPGMSVDGLVSGLSTSDLINQLMQVEAMPQTALRNKVTAAQAVVSAYQAVNTKFAALQTAAETLAKPVTWSAPKATSSSASVAASAAETATTGAITFDVKSLAAAHSLATAEFTKLSDVATGSNRVTITTGTQTLTFTPAKDDVQGLVKSINDSDLGLQAVAVQVSAGRYRLQISATETGAASAFSVQGLGTMTTVRQGADASVDLGGGLVVSSTTNTFKDLLPGTSFTVSKVESAVTVGAAVDGAAISDKVKAFVDAANAALTEVGKYTTYDAAAKKGGALAGDFTVRELASSLLDNVSGTVGTSGSPGAAGIELDRYGKLTFDAEAFGKLYAADPARAQELVEGVADRLAKLSAGATDKTTGTLTLAVQGRNDLVKDLNKRIEDWDTRLELRRTTLQRQFTAMEVALSSMQQQSNWLAGQVAGLSNG